jgi:nitrate/nitrite transporter NarK
VSNETRAQPGDVLIRVGVVIFMVGAVATIGTVIPLLADLTPLPTAAYLVSMLMAVGFAVAIAGVIRSVSHQRRLVRAAAQSQEHCR